MTDSKNLLAEYIQAGSDAAFRELVARYVDLVYSTALRLVEGDTHRAEDVAQTVFGDLARMARTLSPEVRLGGWLHRHTCFVAANLMRGERRRQARERQAVEMNALQNNSQTDFSLVAPMLDEAINELGEADRTAILLRFFEQQDFRAVGQALDSNEDAARMRVTRALEKLEVFLKQRGVTTTAASLSVVLSANAVQAAPVGLAITISTAAALTGTTLATTATVTATKAIAMTALQKTIVTATIAVLAGAGIYEARQASQLREQVQTLQEQQTPLAARLKQLESEREASERQLAALRGDNERLDRNTGEVLRLRGEISRLRSEKAMVSERAVATNAFTLDRKDPNWRPNWSGLVPYDLTKFEDHGTNFSLREAKNVGAATPAALYQTWMYARLTGDTDAFLKVVDFQTELTEEEKEAMTKSNQTSRTLMTDLEARGYHKLQDLFSLGYRSDRYLALLREDFGGEPIVMTAIFRKVGDDWKVVYPNRPKGYAR